MIRRGQLWIATIAALTLTLSLGLPTRAQEFEASSVRHQIEGRLIFRSGQVAGVRVRLVKQAGMQPVAETFSRPEGQFRFTSLNEGVYTIETYENDQFEATATDIAVFPPDRARPSPQVFTVMIDVPLKPPPPTVAPGVITADVDLKVPKDAIKHYRAGMKALGENNFERAVTELNKAIEIYPEYYAARIELGRELRLRKRFKEAIEVLGPLRDIAPRRAEPRVEYGIVLLELQRKAEAADELRKALQLEETSWASHLYLGWALLEERPDQAEPHFTRAIELNEQRAARAHIALARIADSKGSRQDAVKHLETYLALAPNAPDAGAVRKLADTLRK